jgi:hypothetical protein
MKTNNNIGTKGILFIILIILLIFILKNTLHMHNKIRMLKQAKDSLELAMKEVGNAKLLIDSVLVNLNNSEHRLYILKKDVNSINLNFEGSKKINKGKIENLKVKLEEEQQQMHKLQEELQKLK